MKLDELNLHDIGIHIVLAGAVYAGPDQTFYLCLFPDEQDDEDMDLVDLEMDLADWTKFVRQTDLMEMEALAERPDGKVVKAIIRKTQRQIDQRVSWQVYRPDGYKCRYCGNDQVPLSVDHLVLWEEGGPSIPENLVAACKKCNRKRGNMQLAEWLIHPRYRKVSKNLTTEEKRANLELLQDLDSIPRTPPKLKRKR